jgi:hypothetical protein
MTVRIMRGALVGVAFVGVIMRMFAPRPADAIRQQGDARRLVQGDDPGVARDGPQRLIEKGFQFVAHPEDHIGLLQGFGIGRFQRVRVGRGAPLDQQRRCRHAVHDAGDQRVDGDDAGDDARRVGACWQGAAEGKGG